MDILDSIYIAKQAGHAAIGIMNRNEAMIYAENLSFRFSHLSSSEAFIIIFMNVYDRLTIA